MNPLRQALEEYLTVRRALGFKLQEAGSALRRFVEFAEEKGASFITTDLALSWAQQPFQADPAYWTSRLGMVRCFARYCRALDSRTEVPPEGLLPHQFRRKPPYLYSDGAPDLDTWGGRRDRALLLLAVQTGLRVSELVGLSCEDLVLGNEAPYVRCHGKGRKERLTPLRKQTTIVLRDWLRERAGRPSEPLFPNARGSRLSRDGVDHLLAKHVATAGAQCPSLQTKHVSPHVLRHSAAMDLLQHGVDRSVIALWLGHESVHTTEVYIHADMKLKEKVLEKTSPLESPPGRYRPEDPLLAFLESL